MTTKKPTAKKVVRKAAKKPDRPAPMIYLVCGVNCDNGDVFHPDVASKEPWCETARVHGPFDTVLGGLSHIDEYDDSLPDDLDEMPAIFAVIGDGPMYKIAARMDRKIDIQSYFSE